MTNSSSKQQHCSCSNSKIATHRAAAETHDRNIQTHTRIIRRTAAYSLITIYQVQVPCSETTHGAYQKEVEKNNGAPKKKNVSTPRNEPATSYSHGVQATSQPLVVLHDFVVELFVSICTKKNRKEHPPQGDDASTAEADPGRVGRDEQGEAHRANTTPNGAPHL